MLVAAAGAAVILSMALMRPAARRAYDNYYRPGAATVDSSAGATSVCTPTPEQVREADCAFTEWSAYSAACVADIGGPGYWHRRQRNSSTCPNMIEVTPCSCDRCARATRDVVYVDCQYDTVNPFYSAIHRISTGNATYQYCADHAGNVITTIPCVLESPPVVMIHAVRDPGQSSMYCRGEGPDGDLMGRICHTDSDCNSRNKCNTVRQCDEFGTCGRLMYTDRYWYINNECVAETRGCDPSTGLDVYVKPTCDDDDIGTFDLCVPDTGDCATPIRYSLLPDTVCAGRYVMADGYILDVPDRCAAFDNNTYCTDDMLLATGMPCHPRCTSDDECRQLDYIGDCHESKCNITDGQCYRQRVPTCISVPHCIETTCPYGMYNTPDDCQCRCEPSHLAACSHLDTTAENGVCEGGNCVAIPFSCDDHNPCTEDIPQVGGTCRYKHYNCSDSNTPDTLCTRRECISNMRTNEPMCVDIPTHRCRIDNVRISDICHEPIGNETDVTCEYFDMCDDGDPCTLSANDYFIDDRNIKRYICTDKIFIDGCCVDDAGCTLPGTKCQRASEEDTTGLCVHSPPLIILHVCNGTGPCDDGDPCTTGTTCTDGICGGGTSCRGPLPVSCTDPICTTLGCVDTIGDMLCASRVPWFLVSTCAPDACPDSMSHCASCEMTHIGPYDATTCSCMP